MTTINLSETGDPPPVGVGPLLPLFKWSGGKRDEISKFIHHLPTSYNIFIEPFIGGGALYFYLNHSSQEQTIVPVIRNVINDVHNEIINFYQKIKDGFGNDIYELMSIVNNNEEDYYTIRDNCIYEEDEIVDKNFYDAFRFFYIRKTCYRGMLRYNSKGCFNIPFGRYKTYNYDILKDIKYKNLLSNTEITLGSFEKVFEKYGNNEEAFIFLDPPYDSTFTDYGYCQFGREEHNKLSQCFKNSKAKCLMIIGDTTFIRELYSNYIVGQYDKKYLFKITNNRVNEKAVHLIIKNYI